MFSKTEIAFLRTIEAIKFYNITIPHNLSILGIDDFKLWLASIEINEVINWVYEFELKKHELSEDFPSIRLYEKNRWTNISKFQYLVKNGSILKGQYQFNNFCKIIHSKNLNVNIHDFNLDHIEHLKTESYILIRKSITHHTGIFELELKGWNRLLIDLETYNKPINGQDIFNSLSKSFDVKKNHFEKFISNNVVYYDGINVIE